MTLRQLKLAATLIPILAVIALEVVRWLVIGELPIGTRLLMDAVAMAGIIVFSTVIFRFIDRLHVRLHRQNEELLALHSAGLAIAGELSLDAVLKKVVDHARTLVGAKYGALSVIDRSGSIAQFITSGISDDTRAAIGPPPVGHGVLGVVLREGQRLRLSNVAHHPQSSGFPHNHPIMKTLLAVPITTRSPFLGNLYLSEKQNGGEFTAGDEETLERFAVHAAIAIDNAHLHAQGAELAVADERLRIAHEMHDGLAQVLGYVNTKVQAATMYLEQEKPEDAREQLRQLAISAREAYTDVREGIVELRTLAGANRPFDEVLSDYVNRWQEQSGIKAQVVLEAGVRLPPRIELQAVRIVQEALTNVRKHARATTVHIHLERRNASYVITIRDDGVGFDPATKTRGEFPRFGLSTMRERAESVGALLGIEPNPTGGTVVRLQLPVTDILAKS